MLSIVQTIIAANNNRQGGSLKQLLIIVVIVVVYGLKMLANAKKSFMQDKEDDPESSQQRQRGGQRLEIKKTVKKVIPVRAEKIEPYIELEPVGIMPSTFQESESTEQGGNALELDLDDADSLRKAIIYSEILGKPLALRQDS